MLVADRNMEAALAVCCDAMLLWVSDLSPRTSDVIRKKIVGAGREELSFYPLSSINMNIRS